MSNYPNSDFLMCADNDAALPLRLLPLCNAGVVAAERAAREIGAKVSFPPSERESLDWQDVFAKHGREATAAAIRRHTYTP
jgi:phage/plasmid primase-like uncharacterized protein